MVRALRRQRPLSPRVRRGPPHARHLSASDEGGWGGLSDAVRGRQVGSCEDWPVGGPVPQSISVRRGAIFRHRPPNRTRAPRADRPVSA